MTLWLDAQPTPLFAPWINARGLDLGAVPVGEITLRDATDQETFRQVGCAGALVITKDRDFIRLLDEQGPPPRVTRLPVGNGSNAALHPVWSAPFSRGWAGLSAAFRQRHWRRTPSPKAAEFSLRLRSLSLPMGFC
jgi:predicted nuclease of predicted toxin-antitoxin system